MNRHLQYKPDFAATVERFEAWWLGEIVDRPPITLTVTPSRPYRGPHSTHSTLRQRWLDIEFVFESAMARIEQTDYVADAYPQFWSNIGPEITATLFGCELTFTEDSSWSTPIIHDCSDWEQVLERPPDFDNVYWQTMEKMTDYALERSEGRFIVGITDLHGNYDILAALRDPMALCYDLVDCPELVQRVGRHVSKGYVAAFNRLYDKIAAYGMGVTTWLPAYHQGKAYVPSSDFWCMVSPAVARQMIWPDILYEMAPLQRSIFHLDGPQALRHLDLLLDLPQLNAVQWVFGAGRGPARRWIDVYQRIRQAGKSLQLLAEDAQDALAVLSAVGGRGVWVTVDKPFASVAEAEDFVQQVARFR